MSTKTFSFLLLAALAAAQLPDSDHAVPVLKNRKILVGQPVDLTVAQPAAIAVPLTLVAGDYRGPYDPIDPNGIMAASRRRSMQEGHARLQEVKSYIPPGTAEVLRKEIIKLAMNEGSRFALAHPKEAAELMGIVNRASALYGTASRRVKALERKNALANKP